MRRQADPGELTSWRSRSSGRHHPAAGRRGGERREPADAGVAASTARSTVRSGVHDDCVARFPHRPGHRRRGLDHGWRDAGAVGHPRRRAVYGSGDRELRATAARPRGGRRTSAPATVAFPRVGQDLRLAAREDAIAAPLVFVGLRRWSPRRGWWRSDETTYGQNRRPSGTACMRALPAAYDLSAVGSRRDRCGQPRRHRLRDRARLLGELGRGRRSPRRPTGSTSVSDLIDAGVRGRRSRRPTSPEPGAVSGVRGGSVRAKRCPTIVVKAPA